MKIVTIEGKPEEIAAYERALKDGGKFQDPLVLDKSTNPPAWRLRDDNAMASHRLVTGSKGVL